VSTVEVIFLASSVLTFATGLIILSINRWRTINQAYAIAASLASLWLLGVLMAIYCQRNGNDSDILFWLRITNACGAFIPWSFALINISITEHHPLGRAINRSSVWLIAGLLLSILVFSSWFIPEDSSSEEKKRGVAYTVYFGALAVLCLIVIYDVLRGIKKCTGIRLLELKFFVLNICISTLAILVLSSARIIFGLPLLRYAGPIVILASFSLTIWAIFYYRVFDARQMFAALGRYISTMTVLAVSVYYGNQFLSKVTSEPFGLILSCCIAGILTLQWDNWVRSQLNLDLLKKLAGPKAKIVELARTIADQECLIRSFESFLCDWCQTESVSIHTSESPIPPHRLFTKEYTKDFLFLKQKGFITPEMLSRLRPDDQNQPSKDLLTELHAGAVIAVPRGSDSPTSVVTFGQKVSLRPYTYPDVELLIELVETMDNILAHSRVTAHVSKIEKMESAAMMSRGLAHDLNNLTTPVSTFLLHMENKVTPGSTEAEVLLDAQHSIKVMQDYIRESLFYARRLVPDLKRHSVSAIINSVMKLTQQKAQARGITLTSEAPSSLTVTADEALLQRLLQNLILNGIDASPRGATVSITASSIDTEHIGFKVSDQGHGISPVIMDRLFEPYFTTKDTGHDVRGLGLGLAISQKIAALHSGEIKVSSNPLAGSIFSLILPSHLKGLPNLGLQDGHRVGRTTSRSLASAAKSTARP